MLIKLSEEQEHRLLEWSARFAEAELDADIEPAGYEITIEIAPPLPSLAIARKGAQALELGEVVVLLEKLEGGCKRWI